MPNPNENYRVEDQSKNGVRVIVTLWNEGGRTVEADCQCFGHPKRVHSHDFCPLRLAQLREHGGAS